MPPSGQSLNQKTDKCTAAFRIQTAPTFLERIIIDTLTVAFQSMESNLCY